MLLQDRKREEAKLVKREAQKDDFINFVARDSIMLKLLQKRRKAINYTHKMAEIEYVFLQGRFISFLPIFSDFVNEPFSWFELILRHPWSPSSHWIVSKLRFTLNVRQKLDLND